MLPNRKYCPEIKLGLKIRKQQIIPSRLFIIVLQLPTSPSDKYPRSAPSHIFMPNHIRLFLRNILNIFVFGVTLNNHRLSLSPHHWSQLQSASHPKKKRISIYIEHLQSISPTIHSNSIDILVGTGMRYQFRNIINLTFHSIDNTKMATRRIRSIQQKEIRKFTHRSTLITAHRHLLAPILQQSLPLPSLDIETSEMSADVKSIGQDNDVGGVSLAG